MKKRRALSMVLALAMVVSLIATFGFSISADEAKCHRYGGIHGGEQQVICNLKNRGTYLFNEASEYGSDYWLIRNQAGDLLISYLGVDDARHLLWIPGTYFKTSEANPIDTEHPNVIDVAWKNEELANIKTLKDGDGKEVDASYKDGCLTISKDGKTIGSFECDREQNGFCWGWKMNTWGLYATYTAEVKLAFHNQTVKAKKVYLKFGDSEKFSLVNTAPILFFKVDKPEHDFISIDSWDGVHHTTVCKDCGYTDVKDIVHQVNGGVCKCGACETDGIRKVTAIGVNAIQCPEGEAAITSVNIKIEAVKDLIPDDGVKYSLDGKSYYHTLPLGDNVFNFESGFGVTEFWLKIEDSRSALLNNGEGWLYHLERVEDSCFFTVVPEERGEPS